jgi:hypothetical protein
MWVKMYYANEDRNEYERMGRIENVTPDLFKAARAVARLDLSHDQPVVADLIDANGDIIDVLVFSMQMRDRVVAEMRPKN